jgi:hypothetical protein
MAKESEKEFNENAAQDQETDAGEAAWYCCYAGDPAYEDDLYESAQDCCCCCC